VIIMRVRDLVHQWRHVRNPSHWNVTPETARLLQHWRTHPFQTIRPFFCQVEAVETFIWLTEVAPKIGKQGRSLLDHLDAANGDANPLLSRVALKLATGAGKTNVAWSPGHTLGRPRSGLTADDGESRCRSRTFSTRPSA
jgi:type III restriction enzyme